MSWKLELYVPISRRKTVHVLRDENGKQVSVHLRVSEALLFADEAQIRRLEVLSPDGHWLLDFEPFPW